MNFLWGEHQVFFIYGMPRHPTIYIYFGLYGKIYVESCIYIFHTTGFRTSRSMVTFFSLSKFQDILRDYVRTVKLKATVAPGGFGWRRLGPTGNSLDPSGAISLLKSKLPGARSFPIFLSYPTDVSSVALLGLQVLVDPNQWCIPTMWWKWYSNLTSNHW